MTEDSGPRTVPPSRTDGRSPGEALAEEARMERSRAGFGLEQHHTVRTGTPAELVDDPDDPDERSASAPEHAHTHQGAPTSKGDIGGFGRATGRDAGGGDIGGSVGMGDTAGTTAGDSQLGGSNAAGDRKGSAGG